ncbi:MAG TPA: tail fiber protein [Allosphingosinicella sp.]|nr:tail fiber protein [Allosphingosinicella sp.]
MDELMGTVKLFAFHFVPDRWLPCDGRLLPIDTSQQDLNTIMFGLLGSAYGGDGRTNFALPNLAPVQTVDGVPMQYCICMEGLFPQQPRA